MLGRARPDQQRGTRVGVCLRRGPELVIALLAVLKAGGAYVPMDPGFPPGRLEFIASDAGLACLVTDEISRRRLSAGLELHCVVAA